MTEEEQQNIIRYLRGLIDNLESRKVELVEFGQSLEYDTVALDGITLGYFYTGGRVETIRWRPKRINLTMQNEAAG